MIVSADDAIGLATDILCHYGAPTGFAKLQADQLVEAELRGFASHGLLRLPRIVERIQNGVADPKTTGNSEWTSQSVLVTDGLMGLGPVVARHALDQVCERARLTGVAVAAIHNSNHLGMLALYAEHVAKAGQVAICFSTSEALVHPWGGTQALVGTNPIAIGVPASPAPFVMDMATSLVAMGKIHDHANRRQPIPHHWALDRNGRPTTDAEEAKKGAIAPFGEAKGYALGIAFELLVATLTRSALGTEVTGTLDSTSVCNKGDLFIVITPSASTSGASAISTYLDIIRACPPQAGFEAVSVPGDRSTKRREISIKSGFELPDEIWSQLLRLRPTETAIG